MYILERPGRDKTSALDFFPGYAQETANTSQVEGVEPSPCLAYVVHVSLPYSSVLMTQALPTAIFCFTVSKEKLSVMVDPRYVTMKFYYSCFLTIR